MSVRTLGSVISCALSIVLLKYCSQRFVVSVTALVPLVTLAAALRIQDRKVHPGYIRETFRSLCRKNGVFLSYSLLPFYLLAFARTLLTGCVALQWYSWPAVAMRSWHSCFMCLFFSYSSPLHYRRQMTLTATISWTTMRTRSLTPGKTISSNCSARGRRHCASCSFV